MMIVVKDGDRVMFDLPQCSRRFRLGLEDALLLGTLIDRVTDEIITEQAEGIAEKRHKYV